jgi:hypothetical protein
VNSGAESLRNKFLLTTLRLLRSDDRTIKIALQFLNPSQTDPSSKCEVALDVPQSKLATKVPRHPRLSYFHKTDSS